MDSLPWLGSSSVHNATVTAIAVCSMFMTMRLVHNFYMQSRLSAPLGKGEKALNISQASLVRILHVLLCIYFDSCISPSSGKRDGIHMSRNHSSVAKRGHAALVSHVHHSKRSNGKNVMFTTMQ